MRNKTKTLSAVENGDAGNRLTKINLDLHFVRFICVLKIDNIFYEVGYHLKKCDSFSLFSI